VQIVVGLGNPGARYERTRHNVGFDVADRIAERHGVALSTKRFKARLGSGRVSGQSVVVALPQTFMNCSGESIGPMAGWYKVPPEQVIVVHDELDLPFGRVKVKAGGGHGGHNGLRDLASKLPSRDFVRVRVGIGRPDGRMDPAAWVLARWSPEQAAGLPDLIEQAADAVEAVLQHGVREAMNRLNGEGRQAKKEA
jgi:PTH1 family peptidyl-tRNA hydrolase